MYNGNFNYNPNVHPIYQQPTQQPYVAPVNNPYYPNYINTPPLVNSQPPTYIQPTIHPNPYYVQPQIPTQNYFQQPQNIQYNPNQQYMIPSQQPLSNSSSSNVYQQPNTVYSNYNVQQPMPSTTSNNYQQQPNYNENSNTQNIQQSGYQQQSNIYNPNNQQVTEQQNIYSPPTSDKSPRHNISQSNSSHSISNIQQMNNSSSLPQQQQPNLQKYKSTPIYSPMQQSSSDTKVNIRNKSNTISSSDVPTKHQSIPGLYDPNDPNRLNRNIRSKTVSQKFLDIASIPTGEQKDSINVMNKNIEEIPIEAYKSCATLTSMKLVQTKILDIPQRVSKLENLSTLIIRKSNIRSFEHLTSLSKLSYLDLGQNKIDQVPLNISVMTSLVHLNIEENTISHLPDSITDLVNLNFLNVSNNKLKSLNVSNLKKLKTLDFSSNEIEIYPTGINTLEELRILNFDHNRFGHIHTAFFSFKHLKRLSASHNLITVLSIPQANCNKLDYINLSYNKLTSIPLELYSFKSLTYINLSHNSISDLSDDIGNLASLKYLDLSNNNLDTLPPNIQSLSNLNRESLKYDNNPLREIPNEIKRKGFDTILKFVGGLKDKMPWRRMKLVFVGQENVGKTSLMRAIRSDNVSSSKSKKVAKLFSRFKKREESSTNQNAPNVATDGIDIEEWAPDLSEYLSLNEDINKQLSSNNDLHNIIYTTWDFAGQEVYYPTHQFFLTSRSIYLIIFNLMDQESSRIDYWFQMVKIRANKEAKAILVGTHLDDKKCDKKFLSDVLTSMKKKYKHFPFFHDVIAVSTKTGAGIDKLKEEIISITLKLPTIKVEVPRSYVQLERAIKGRKQEFQYLKLRDFKKHFGSYIKSADNIEDIIEFLNDVGVLTYLNKGNNEKDDNLIILDPQWIADLFSSIISLKHSYIKEGILEKISLRQLWREYGSDIHEQLLNVLEEFEICYPISNERLLIPCMLPNMADTSLKDIWPSNQNWRYPLGRYYKFPFLPLGFFGRLILRFNKIVKSDDIQCWGNGFIVTLGKERGYCIFNEFLRDVFIEVRCSGDKSTKRSLLQLILGCIDTLTSEYYKMIPKVKVPCPHCLENNFLKIRYFTYEECVLSIGSEDESLICYNNDKVGTPQVRILNFLGTTIRNDNVNKSNHTNTLNVDDVAPELLLSEYKDLVIPFNQIEVGDVFASGGFAILHKSTYKGRTVALKKFINQGQDADMLSEAYREIQNETLIMSKMKHPNLVELIGICKKPLCMVMEFLELGSLDKHLRGDKKRNFTWYYRVKVALDVARGAAKLHENDIIHRDLRSPNILVVSFDENNPVVAKLADFGLSLSVGGFLQGVKDYNEYWTAPEIMSKSRYGSKADVFSYGIVLWELLQIGFPYEEYELGFRSDHEKAVIEGRRPTIPNSTPKKFSNLIQNCWKGEEEERPTFDEIIVELENMLNESRSW